MQEKSPAILKASRWVHFLHNFRRTGLTWTIAPASALRGNSAIFAAFLRRLSTNFAVFHGDGGTGCLIRVAGASVTTRTSQFTSESQCAITCLASFEK
jgi:hypothetical protein